MTHNDYAQHEFSVLSLHKLSTLLRSVLCDTPMADVILHPLVGQEDCWVGMCSVITRYQNSECPDGWRFYWFDEGSTRPLRIYPRPWSEVGAHSVKFCGRDLLLCVDDNTRRAHLYFIDGLDGGPMAALPKPEHWTDGPEWD